MEEEGKLVTFLLSLSALCVLGAGAAPVSVVLCFPFFPPSQHRLKKSWSALAALSGALWWIPQVVVVIVPPASVTQKYAL